GIERIDVRNAAVHEQKDDITSAGREMRSASPSTWVRLSLTYFGHRRISVRPVRHERGQCQHAKAVGRAFQHLAPSHGRRGVAGTTACFAIRHPMHERPPDLRPAYPAPRRNASRLACFGFAIGRAPPYHAGGHRTGFVLGETPMSPTRSL